MSKGYPVPGSTSGLRSEEEGDRSKVTEPEESDAVFVCLSKQCRSSVEAVGLVRIEKRIQQLREGPARRRYNHQAGRRRSHGRRRGGDASRRRQQSTGRAGRHNTNGPRPPPASPRATQQWHVAACSGIGSPRHGNNYSSKPKQRQQRRRRRQRPKSRGRSRPHTASAVSPGRCINLPRPGSCRGAKTTTHARVD